MKMPRIVLAFLVATIISGTAFAGSTVQRDAPTTRFYDSRGNSTGSASMTGGRPQ